MKERAEYVHAHPEAKPRGAFLCDMADLFGPWMPAGHIIDLLEVLRHNGHDRFYLLTKYPENLVAYSPFPPNCWVGTTCDTVARLNRARMFLPMVKATVKFLSIEPMLERVVCNHEYVQQEDDMREEYQCGEKYCRLCGHSAPISFLEPNNLTRLNGGQLVPIADWVILGAQTKPDRQPEPGWVRQVYRACGDSGIPLFTKDNVWPLLQQMGEKTHRDFPRS